MLGGDRKGAKSIGAQKEQHGVREGVEEEVGAVLGTRSWLDQREG